MGYIDKNLMKDEQIIYRASLSWVIYLSAAVWAFLGVLALFFGRDGFALAVLFFLIAAIALIRAVLAKKTSDFAVTNRRLILKTGVISRNIVELMLTKCEGVALDQSILGRILGYGTLLTTTGGVTNKFKMIKDPITFRNYINHQIDEAQRNH